MEIRQLGYFIAVAEERSFTNAARRAHTVQSTISSAVAALEKELNVKLFHRTSRHVSLTEEGIILLGVARSVLQEVNAAEEAISEASLGLRGTIRLGLMHAVLTPRFASVLSAFHRDRPLVQLAPSTHPRGASGLVEDVANGKLDFALTTVEAASTAPKGVSWIPLDSEEMVLICPPQHRLASRGSVVAADVRDECFIDVPAGWGSRISADLLFNSEGIARRIDLEIGDVPTLVSLVAAGLGVAVVAPSSANDLEGVTTVRIDPAPVFRTCVVFPCAGEHSRVARDFLSRIRSTYGGKGVPDCKSTSTSTSHSNYASFRHNTLD